MPKWPIILMFICIFKTYVRYFVSFFKISLLLLFFFYWNILSLNFFFFWGGRLPESGLSCQLFFFGDFGGLWRRSWNCYSWMLVKSDDHLDFYITRSSFLYLVIDINLTDTNAEYNGTAVSFKDSSVIWYVVISFLSCHFSSNQK